MGYEVSGIVAEVGEGFKDWIGKGYRTVSLKDKQTSGAERTAVYENPHLTFEEAADSSELSNRMGFNRYHGRANQRRIHFDT